ncbi:MAG: pyridoxal-phosphate dependent enzyme [Alphaproteobacteria bacterium]|nr:pyridoxal-phosphate dependent enzyme [Alphaproteobacteria bacterium]
MIGIAQIEAARTRIAGYVRKTPAIVPLGLKEPLPVDCKVTLKLECLQVTGSFKARGAMNRLLSCTPEQIAAGIVTASGGNHGLAVARTAFAAGTRATIFLPKNVSPAKLAKLKDWGADARIVGDAWDESNAAALDFAKANGATYFHPFSDPDVVAGQGTLGLDILDDMPDIDTILIAIGGGGLIAGLATAMRARRPDIRIVGIEPVGAPTLRACLDAGRLVGLEKLSTRVPTMACRKTSQEIYDLVRGSVDRIVLVDDDAMQDAARWLWFELGVAADLSGAASIAALRTKAAELGEMRHVCALICGAGPEGIET